MDSHQKVLCVDASSGYYRILRYPVGDFFGPVDLGLHLAARHNSLNIGVGLLAGSVFPGSNRLIFTGFSPCWGGFYISSMGGAGLVFDNLGINMVSILGKAPQYSILYLNRRHGEEIDVRVEPLAVRQTWKEGRQGIYAVMDRVFGMFGNSFEEAPRILAVGPASETTDFGAIGSVPIEKGKLTQVDTWAGRGGFGSRLLQQHGIAAVIYGGTHIDDDFRDRTIADRWFADKYHKKLAAKDLESTTKYRFDPAFHTGGTFGVNFARLKGRMLSFNYRSIYFTEEQRRLLHKHLVEDHYLKQFNTETIETRQQRTCGEPCSAVCKKMHGEFKKDYEPYQTMGPLAGVFDQRAAETLTHQADTLGFDAISAGGVVSWLMECLSQGILQPEELGVSQIPRFDPEGFDVVADSAHNSAIGCGILKSIVEKRGILDLREGARKFARHLARQKGKAALDPFVYVAFARKGWMVPNQYWTSGPLSPMAIMGKYYMHYGEEFLPPRELGRTNAGRFRKELVLDMLGMCRFHRGWAEEMLPDIVESLYGLKSRFLNSIGMTASRINSRNASMVWESQRCVDLVHSFLERCREVEGDSSPELASWLDRFRRDKNAAALDFWYEIHKGISESLREF